MKELYYYTMVLIRKGTNQRFNINTYRNNLIKYNRTFTNTTNTEYIQNNESLVNTHIYENINKVINTPYKIENNLNINIHKD